MSKVKARNYGYQSKKEEKTPRISKKTRNLIFALVALCLVGMIVLFCIEPKLENKLVIKNRSSHDIKSLHLWYEDSEGAITDIMSFDKIPSKEKITESTEGLGLSELQGDAWLSVQIAFEDGGQAVLQTGQFLYDFNGKIMFEVSDTDSEDLMLHLQAGEGLFNSTSTTECDDIYYINPENGYIE